MADQSYILLVEHNPDDAAFAQSLLSEKSGSAIPRMRRLQTLEAALRVLDAEPGCAAVLLDFDAPGDAAHAALSAIHAHAPQVPVIALLGEDNPDEGLAAVLAGAQDYLVKGRFDAGVLGHALQYASRRGKVESALIERSLHDSLTGLPRRYLLLDRLGVAMRRCARDGSSGALLFIDLSGLKQCNHDHGHASGDEALRAVITRVAGLVRSSDTLARVQGDQFAVLLPKESGLLEALAIGEKLLVALREPLTVGAHTLEFSASIGVVRFRDATETPEQLVQRANDTMDATGKESKGRVRLL